jgi:hypothetical protein
MGAGQLPVAEGLKRQEWDAAVSPLWRCRPVDRITLRKDLGLHAATREPWRDPHSPGMIERRTRA